MTDSTTRWLARGTPSAGEADAGAVLRAWRKRTGRTQVEVAALLDTSQQHLSQIEKGLRPLSLEQRRVVVARLGIAPEELGLSSGQSRHLVSHDDASPEIGASRLRWREERRWLNAHRSQLAQLAAQLYPTDRRIPRTPLIAGKGWLANEPIELADVALDLDEGPQCVVVDGSEPASAATRPLRIAGSRFEHYTSAVKHLDPPQLFESRPSYRLLDASLVGRRLRFGLAAYFDKLDISEALGHELAATCMLRPSLLSSSGRELAGLLPFRQLIVTRSISRSGRSSRRSRR